MGFEYLFRLGDIFVEFAKNISAKVKNDILSLLNTSLI